MSVLSHLPPPVVTPAPPAVKPVALLDPMTVSERDHAVRALKVGLKHTRRAYQETGSGESIRDAHIIEYALKLLGVDL